MGVFIIAEAGVNHNGDLATAYRLVDAAVAAGADAIKFQTFKAENLTTRNADKASYQKQNTGNEENQLTMLKSLELKYEWHFQLLNHCQQSNIQMLSTAFDFDSLNFLVNELDIDLLKIPSGEITNGPFLLAHAQTNKPIILSTGMSTLGEVEIALGVLSYGYLSIDHDCPAPNPTAFEQAFRSELGQNLLKQKVSLLHCTSEYPTPATKVHLKAMDTLAQAFELNVGYSDHTIGLSIPIAAAARGAKIIEKHFTLNKTQTGPDHLISLEPNELKTLICSIRDIEQALGSSIKFPQISELETRQLVRKSLVAASAITSGTPFSSSNLAIKRPASGRTPMDYWNLLDKISSQNYDADDFINT